MENINKRLKSINLRDIFIDFFRYLFLFLWKSKTYTQLQ